jgi:hypothetical protein
MMTKAETIPILHIETYHNLPGNNRSYGFGPELGVGTGICFEEIMPLSSLP